MPAWVIELIAPLASVLLKLLVQFAQNHLPELLEDVHIAVKEWILERKEIERRNKEMSNTVNLTVKNQQGSPISGASVYITMPGIGKATTAKVTDAEGKAVYSGLTSSTTYQFDVSATGFKDNKVVVTTEASDSSQNNDIVLESTTINAVAENVVSVVTTTVGAETITNAEKTIGDTIDKAIEEGTDWDTVKKNAEGAIQSLSGAVSGTGSVTTDMIDALVAEAKKEAFDEINKYKSSLMVLRHSKSFWECVGIDLELAGILTFQYWVSSEVNSLVKKLKEKLAEQSK